MGDAPCCRPLGALAILGYVNLISYGQVQTEIDLASQETVQNDALQLSLFESVGDSGV
jgi:hypothetical protein